MLVAGAVSAASLACEEPPTPRAVPVPSSKSPARVSLLSKKPLADALEQLQKKTGPEARALKLIVFSDRIVLQVQDQSRPKNVDQYVFRSGAVEGPVPVKLKGTGKLEDNLFPLSEAKLDIIQPLITRAIEAARVEDGQVTKVVLKRNLPKSMDVQFRVYIVGPRRDATVDADKDGRVLPSRDQ